MSSENLTKDQLAFLEECKLEFSDRFTDSDLDFKSIYDLGIPTPPIMCPWYGRARFNNRDRPGASRHHEHRDYRNRDEPRYENNYKDRDYGHNENRYNRRHRPY